MNGYKVADFNRFDFDPIGSRTSVDIIAPGKDVDMAGRNNMSSGLGVNGTSFAAPHVTGAIGLLGEHAKIQIDGSVPNWDEDSHRHEVTKAVLMNSADKVEGFLGMDRTVLKQNGDNWFDSQAVFSQTPVDVEMGTGHLNVGRALEQFMPGESDSTGSKFAVNAPLIGWDFSSINNSFDYFNFDTPLSAGDYVSATVAWDRLVDLNNLAVGEPDEYDQGDAFAHDTNRNIDLYLVRRGESINQTVASSVANFQSSVEHIFAKVPDDGDYSLILVATQAGPTDYGVAWWAGEVEVSLLPGDFDADGDVDDDDLSQWQGDFGINGDSDADNDGDTDGADFLAWQRNFGATSLSASTAVPEPSCLLLLVFGLPLLLSRKFRPDRVPA